MSLVWRLVFGARGIVLLFSRRVASHSCEYLARAATPNPVINNNDDYDNIHDNDNSNNDVGNGR